MSQIHTDVGCVIILPRMSQIFTDVGACEKTRIARITRMQHKKKSVKIRGICGSISSSKICDNPWNLWEYILKQNTWESVESAGVYPQAKYVGIRGICGSI